MSNSNCKIKVTVYVLPISELFNPYRENKFDLTLLNLMCLQLNLGANLDREMLLTSEEAVIGAAASELLGLAKAAVKAAKDASMMVNPHKSTKSDSTTVVSLPGVDDSKFEKNQIADLAQRVVRDSKLAEVGLGKNYTCSYPAVESNDVEPSADELEFLEALLSKNTTVRSTRQTERKSRRTRAAEKAASNTVSVRSGPSSRKNQSSLKDVDYSDPLRYFRGATNTSRLLTASEEQALSQGIQVTPREIMLHRLHLSF